NVEPAILPNWIPTLPPACVRVINPKERQIQPTAPVVIIACEDEVRVEILVHLGSPAIWVIGVASAEGPGAVGHLTHAAEMVTREIVVHPGDLLALAEKAADHRTTGVVSLFAKLAAAPDEPVGTEWHAVRLLDDLHTAPQSVVTKLG